MRRGVHPPTEGTYRCLLPGVPPALSEMTPALCQIDTFGAVLWPRWRALAACNLAFRNLLKHEELWLACVSSF